MSGSIRARITIVATVVVAVALVLASWIVLRMVERDLLATTERALAAELELEATGFPFAEDDVIFDFEAEGRPLGFSLFELAEEGVAFGELYEGDALIGEIFIDLDELEVIEVIDPLSGLPLDDAELIEELEDVALDIREIEDEAIENASFFVGAAARDEVDESLTAVRDALMLIVPALVVAMAALIWFLVGRALRPVRAMSDRVEAISTSSLDQRVPSPGGNDEISHLAGVMNRMLDRLQRGDQRQRQFSADASHELRSPLSTVRAAAERIERKPTSPHTEGLAADIVAEADRMDHLISDLLELARADEVRVGVDRDVVDLASLVYSRVPAESRDASSPVNGLFVYGSHVQLERVIDNLVANAERHSSERVTVSVANTDDSTITLRVDDDGPGISPGDRERVFERFSRLDDARARDDGGVGLGLALVKAIIERHQGTVRVEASAELGGASFIVDVPAVPSAATSAPSD